MERVVINLSDLADAFPCSPSYPEADDEQPWGTPAPRRRRRRRFAALRTEVDRRVGELRPGTQVEGGARSPVTLAAAQAAADPGLDAHSAAKNLHSFNQEDELVGHVPCNCKCCLKSSPPVLVGRKKENHVQVDGNCKRVARPAAKNDSNEPAAPEEIFETLREIPRLERADLLRAYSTLIRDDRLFRSLMALPEDMRKDWLLMEIRNQ